jgi:hypothetical protein
VHHRLVAVSSQVVEQTLNHHLVTFFAEKSRLFMHFTIQEKWQIAISFHRKATIEGKIRNTSASLLHQMPL